MAGGKQGILAEAAPTPRKPTRRPTLQRELRDDPTRDPNGYKVDFHAWCHRQARLMRAGRLASLDLPNLIEELESMGRSEQDTLLSHRTVVLMHLLKWVHQPALRSRSWQLTLREHRRRIARQEAASPSLRAAACQMVAQAYNDARGDAAVETGLALHSFPAECPFTLEQIRDIDWLPE
jgi:hypothetical protein